MKSKIVFEDEELIVIGKPAGIAVQSASVMQTDVVSELKNYLGTEDIGLVHRLDQPVEGLIVVGKNKKATAKLSAGLSDGSIKKSYKALAFDESGLRGAGEKFTLEDMMLKDPKTKRAVILKDIDSKKVAAGNRKGGRDRKKAPASSSVLCGRWWRSAC